MNGLIAAFAGYFVVIAVIGYAAVTRTNSAADYSIGGRSLPASVAALSAGASDMSGWLLLGLPGAVFASGLVEAWIVVGLVIGAWLNWRLVAPRLRMDSEALSGAVTLPQLFSRRTHGDAVGGRALRVVASLLILVFFTIYTAAGFVAGAKLFEATLGLEYHVALVIGLVVIMAYTALGGFLAVSWTDVVQALLMVAALAVVPILALTGPTSGELNELNLNFTSIGAMGLVSLLAWGLGYFGQPHILARFMAVSDVAAVPRARRIGMSWMLVSSVGALGVGVVGAARIMGLEDPETVFIALSRLVLNPWLAGIVVAAILAAVMSTVDSQLLVASTALAEDTLAVADDKRLLVSRAMVVVVAAVAGLFAMDPNSGVLEIVAYAWAGLGASFGPCVLACLYWRGTTARGLMAGMLVGGGVTIVWRNLSGGLFDVYEIVPAFTLASIAIYAVGRAWPSAMAAACYDRLRGGLSPDQVLRSCA